MSRIGKKLIELPAGVTLTVGTGNVVTVKGPKGQLTQDIDRDISVEINGNIVELKRPTDQIRHRALHGLSRALVNNLVVGVTAGFKKELELVGVGYKASSQSNILDLSLGYSHNIIFEIPSELSVRTTQEKY
jgi:large subunit ribosomal protein L6